VTATHCNTLQHTATQHTATHHNTLQLTATHQSLEKQMTINKQTTSKQQTNTHFFSYLFIYKRQFSYEHLKICRCVCRSHMFCHVSRSCCVMQHDLNQSFPTYKSIMSHEHIRHGPRRLISVTSHTRMRHVTHSVTRALLAKSSRAYTVLLFFFPPLTRQI